METTIERTSKKPRPEFSVLDQLDPPTDARVEVLLNRYRARYGLDTGPAPNDGSLWFGLHTGGRLAVAVNVRTINPGLLEVMNVCPVRGRNGVLATYEALRRFKDLVDTGVYTGTICHVLYANQKFVRALSRIYGQKYVTQNVQPEPYALVYKYGKV